MTLLETYNNIYSKTHTNFQPPLAPFIKDILLYKKNGVVADIGAGRGQNAVFLGEKGFEVDALDFSEESVKRIKEMTNQIPSITAKEFDVKKSTLEKDYDVILCNFTLHHFNKSERDGFFSEIKKHTKNDGLNLISALVSVDGTGAVKHDDVDIFYLQAGELKNIYSDWEILKFKQEKDETTNPKTGETEIDFLEFILAKKHH